MGITYKAFDIDPRCPQRQWRLRNRRKQATDNIFAHRSKLATGLVATASAGVRRDAGFFGLSVERELGRSGCYRRSVLLSMTQIPAWVVESLTVNIGLL
jgi:hypothetical protein